VNVYSERLLCFPASFGLSHSCGCENLIFLENFGYDFSNLSGYLIKMNLNSVRWMMIGDSFSLYVCVFEGVMSRFIGIF
jgi:hypothetical protein